MVLTLDDISLDWGVEPHWSGFDIARPPSEEIYFSALFLFFAIFYCKD